MIPDGLRNRLHEHGQAHVLDALEKLSEKARADLLAQIERIDLGELQSLYARREQKDALPDRARVEPLPRPADEQDDDSTLLLGEDAIYEGKIAYLVVAGGQGTRLGFDHPKGMFPIGPVSKKPLFQVFAEKVLALRRRTGARLPLLVMTSPATDAETRLFFKRRNYFRLPPQDVWFFCQGTMPALDLGTGRLLLEAPDRLALSPNGHGGTITGLHESGILARLEKEGIRTIYYFQVDNPLADLGDIRFIGKHLASEAEVSSKVVPKVGPDERVGNFLLVDGGCSMIEYSDLPKDWAHETDAQGQLLFWAANPAIHLFDVAFLQKIASEAERLPWHLARKKVPYLDDSGKLVKPETENALKFERFIFDILPQAERWTIFPIAREEEFAPVKNKDGADSPMTAQKLMRDQAARWLRQVGVEVPDGITVEISPLFALDVADLRFDREHIPPIKKNTYLREVND